MTETTCRPGRLSQHRGGSGPPVVLLHGIGGSWRQWLPGAADRLTATERAMASTVGAAPGRPMEVSAELLGQSDDDALGATQEAESVDVLVLRDLADQFGAVAAQAG